MHCSEEYLFHHSPTKTSKKISSEKLFDPEFEFNFWVAVFDTMDKKDKSDSLRNSTASTELNNGKRLKLSHVSAYRHSLALPEKRKKLIRQKRIYESEDNTRLNQTGGIVVNQEQKHSVLNGNI